MTIFNIDDDLYLNVKDEGESIDSIGEIYELLFI
jgi:hypothetical protein